MVPPQTGCLGHFSSVIPLLSDRPGLGPCPLESPLKFCAWGWMGMDLHMYSSKTNTYHVVVRNTDFEV